jgi:hypothetical protein
MVRAELVGSFNDSCYVVQQEESTELQRALLSMAGTYAARGMHNSSVHLNAIDESASVACKRTAERLFEHLLELLGAEPLDASAAKADELAALLVAKIDLAAIDLKAIRDDALAKVGRGLSGPDWSSQLMQMPRALANARMMCAAKVRTAALGSINRGGYVMNTSNIFNGPVGVGVQGAGSTANVVQTNNAAPSQADILAALESIRQTVVAAQAGDSARHVDELEAVDALTMQARKDKPSRVTVPGVISGLSGTARLLAYAPAAIDTLMAWSRALSV